MHRVGTILVAPTSVVVDWFIQHFVLRWQAFVGIALILLGFTGFLISEFVQIRRGRSRPDQSSRNAKVVAGSNIGSSRLKEKEPLLDEKKNPDSPVALSVWKNNWKTKIVSYLI